MFWIPVVNLLGQLRRMEHPNPNLNWNTTSASPSAPVATVHPGLMQHSEDPAVLICTSRQRLICRLWLYGHTHIVDRTISNEYRTYLSIHLAVCLSACLYMYVILRRECFLISGSTPNPKP